MSYIFVYNRYYQYKNKKIPKSRNTALTILLGIVCQFIAIIPAMILFFMLYGDQLPIRSYSRDKDTNTDNFPVVDNCSNLFPFPFPLFPTYNYLFTPT